MNILISGCTCSGKTTLANLIKKELNASVINQDSYYKDLINIPKTRYGYLLDSINAFSIQEYIKDASDIQTKSIYIPNYDISTNKRLSKDILLEPSDLNVFEGLHTITLLKNLKDTLKVFIDTDLNTCLERRIQRDNTIDKSKVIEFYNTCILPMYYEYIEPQKRISDIVLKNGEEICLLKKLKKY